MPTRLFLSLFACPGVECSTAGDSRQEVDGTDGRVERDETGTAGEMGDTLAGWVGLVVRVACWVCGWKIRNGCGRMTTARRRWTGKETWCRTQAGRRCGIGIMIVHGNRRNNHDSIFETPSTVQGQHELNLASSCGYTHVLQEGKQTKEKKKKKKKKEKKRPKAILTPLTTQSPARPGRPPPRTGSDSTAPWRRRPARRRRCTGASRACAPCGPDGRGRPRRS